MQSTVVYGPPGTGKSTYLIREMSRFIATGVPLERIGLVSYTKAAAAELATRAGVPAGGKIATMHSYAFRMAGIVKDQVVDAAKLQKFSTMSGIETVGNSAQADLEQLGEGDFYLALYSLGRARLVNDVAGFQDLYTRSGRPGTLGKFMYFVNAYNTFKASHGYVDFSDMIDMAVGKDPDVDVLILDEAQDCTPAQWRLFESWLPYVEHSIVAGDDDQTLYVWNGADPDGMVQFEKKHAAVKVVLDQSFRVPVSAWKIATRMIEAIPNRVHKEYKPREFEGQVRKFSDFRMLTVDPAQDTMILVRNHSLKDQLEPRLIEGVIPYSIEGGMPGPLQSRYAAAVRIWFKAREAVEKFGMDMLNTRESQLLARVAKPMYHSRVTSEAVILNKQWFQVLQIPRFMEAYFLGIIKKYGNLDPETRVRICTIHASKGREADRVILINGRSDKTAQDGDEHAEIRTFYVAVTRARSTLDIVLGDNPMRQLL